MEFSSQDQAHCGEALAGQGCNGPVARLLLGLYYGDIKYPFYYAVVGNKTVGQQASQPPVRKMP